MIALISAVLVQSFASSEFRLNEDPALPRDFSREEAWEPVPPDPKHDPLLYLEATLRFTFPGGDVVSGGPKYGDIFNVGVGGGVQVDYLWKLTRALYLGAYLEVDVDSFGGKTTTDSFGDTLKPDTMTTFRILGGIKAREEFAPDGRFFFEEFLGLGANRYPSVQGTLTSGGTVTTGELFASGTTVAFDLGLTVGWNVSPQVGLFLSVVVEVNGGPGEGKDLVFVSSTGSTTPGVMVNAGVNLGVNIRF